MLKINTFSVLHTEVFPCYIKKKKSYRIDILCNNNVDIKRSVHNAFRQVRSKSHDL
jgi:hypothetical protein